MINVPSFVIMIPYGILSQSHGYWSPHGISAMDWAALSEPFLGILFWWMAGRGIEALLSALGGVTQPRLRPIEAAMGLVELTSGGLLAMIPITDPDTSRFVNITMLSGGLIWLGLGAAVIVAWVLQLRLRRKVPSATANSTD
jgi:hypothetical protein